MAFLSQAFFDESGGHDKPFMVLGGYVGAVEMWKRFSDDWNAVLDGKADGLPAWPSFHSVEAENGKEGFGVLCPLQRKKRIGHLIAVIAKHRPIALLGTVDVPRFLAQVRAEMRDAGLEPRRKQYWNHPYSFLAYYSVGNLFNLCNAVGEKTAAEIGTIEPVFDHMDKIGGATRKMIQFGVIEAVTESEPGSIAKRVGSPRWIQRNERANWSQLQAADLLVWHHGRAKNSKEPHRRAYRSLQAAAKPYHSYGRVDLQNVWIRGHVGDLLHGRTWTPNFEIGKGD